MTNLRENCWKYIKKERLWRIFSSHVKAESRESFLWISDKSAWKACDATMHCIHLFISLLREYDGKKYQDGNGDDCSENESRFDTVKKCASLRLPARLLKTKKDHFQQHQRGREDALLLIFGGGEDDAFTWKMTVPCSSFSARDSISCSFPSLMMISMLMRKLIMISMMMMTITFQAASPHCFAWYLQPQPPVVKIMAATFLLFCDFFVIFILHLFDNFLFAALAPCCDKCSNRIVVSFVMQICSVNSLILSNSWKIFRWYLCSGRLWELALFAHSCLEQFDDLI